MDRKTVTFEQAEGVVPLPPQLKLKELSAGLRASLWHHVLVHFKADVQTGYDRSYLVGAWKTILHERHSLHDHLPSDEFKTSAHAHEDKIKLTILRGNYALALGWIQWVIRHRLCPQTLRAAVKTTLEEGRAAYRLVEDTIVPIGSEAELKTIERAFKDVEAAEFNGARLHLKAAATKLSEGLFADSVRESIHSVESVARCLEPTGDFSKALAKLQTKANIHGALRAGFASIYGYTSDSEGIRHALLLGGGPQVDETDALFMLGACASFVSYLIHKSRTAGLLDAAPAAG